MRRLHGACATPRCSSDCTPPRAQLPAAVCVNFRDYGPDRRGVRVEAVDAVLCAPPYTQRTFRTQVFETSMHNCFGLHALHAFLTVPFLAH
jgi:hypothetical protein